MTERLLFLDFETFWSQDYSLTKMTPAEYILDPRFEMQGLAYAYDSDPTAWVDGPDVERWLKAQDWSKVVAVAHNMPFDGAIMAWRYGVVPAMYADTLGMARALYGSRIKSMSLATLAESLLNDAKGKALLDTKGMRFAEIKASQFYGPFMRYAIQDLNLCRKLFFRLIEQFPANELLLVDELVRMITVPKFELDVVNLSEHLIELRARKEQLLSELGVDKAVLMSNPKFAELLKSHGVEPPMKVSPTTGKDTYAFAKSDEEFMELAASEDEHVSMLVNARLGVKSTIEETRTESFIKIGMLPWSDGTRKMPVPLRYSGAHTHRFCLVGDTLIDVLRDNRVVSIRLDQLRADDLVWDGEAFVTHGGLAYAGVKEVMTYDGVRGTPDHRVWTVEQRYRPLAEAAARSVPIARGGVPDPARIDTTVLWADRVFAEGEVYLHSVWPGVPSETGGHTGQVESVVQSLRGPGAHGRHDSIGVDASRRGGVSAQEESVSAGSAESCAATGTAVYQVAGETALSELGPWALEGRHVYRSPSVSALPESGGVELRVLRGAGDRSAVSVDGASGELDSGELGPSPCWGEPRQAGFRQALRAGEPALGVEGAAGAEPFLEPTWDIVSCGPRNRFVANGRIVHNSGDWSLNLQNLPRSSTIRRAMKAPNGAKIVAADASQIEARVVAWLAGQTDLVNVFATGGDPYCAFATKVYKREITKADKVERQVGKTAVLGLGFGMGAAKFEATLKRMAKLDLGPEFAQSVVDVYRSSYQRIPQLWRTMEQGLLTLLRGDSMRVGPLVFENSGITLPSGLRIEYPKLRRDNDQQWLYSTPKGDKYLFGGKVTENVVQALARCATMEAHIQVRKEIGLELALQVHDQLVYVVPQHVAGDTLAYLISVMSKSPDWAPGLPLAAEGGIGATLAEAEGK